MYPLQKINKDLFNKSKLYGMGLLYLVYYFHDTNFSSFPPNKDQDSLKKSQGVGPIRKVLLLKEDYEGLGISITVRSSASSLFSTFT